MDGDGLRLNMNGLDYLILALYFVTVLGVGFAARRAIRTSVDFFLSGRSLPAWVTGLAFVSANQRERLQHRLHLRHLAGVHPP
ncbi:hypothetical protein [Micromonospora sp. DH14]|uniref:hypothetical protein n=1 Tax=Micromonospora sp. DH14 TaxID=3040120 RepID=UPI0024413AE9|nr:hypothetical protein [Micromonospora sp. DH14]MDG9677690.1 hypothetical protein [Micromonospora sp. DH14]